MELAERLRPIVDALPPGASVTLPGDVLRAWLADAEPAADDVTSDPGDDLSVAQLSARLNRAPSTIRSWISDGAFPNAYMLRGRSWRVPRADVTLFQAEEAARYHAARHAADDDSGAARAPHRRRDADTAAWRNHMPETGR
jgi:excisionase family DNA binding protein